MKLMLDALTALLLASITQRVSVMALTRPLCTSKEVVGAMEWTPTQSLKTASTELRLTLDQLLPQSKILGLRRPTRTGTTQETIMTISTSTTGIDSSLSTVMAQVIRDPSKIQSSFITLTSTLTDCITQWLI